MQKQDLLRFEKTALADMVNDLQLNWKEKVWNYTGREQGSSRSEIK